MFGCEIYIFLRVLIVRRLEWEANGDAAFGSRIGEGVADIWFVDVGLEECAKREGGTKRVFSADLGHPYPWTRGNLAGILVDFADISNVTVIGDVGLQYEVAF